MDRSDIIKLIGTTKTQDAYGVWRETPSAREVMCQTESITQREFYEGGRAGINPEFKFTMFFADYENELIVEYNKNTYAVYRTYRRKDDKIELYVERKGGTNGKGYT